MLKQLMNSIFGEDKVTYQCAYQDNQPPGAGWEQSSDLYGNTVWQREVTYDPPPLQERLDGKWNELTPGVWRKNETR